MRAPLLFCWLVLASSAAATPADPVEQEPSAPPAQAAPDRAPPPQLTPPPALPKGAADAPAGLDLHEPVAADMLNPAIGAGTGCVACGGPTTLVGLLSGAAGVGGVLAFFSLLPPPVAVLLFGAGTCVGVPCLALAGPAAISGSLAGTLAGAQWNGPRKNVVAPVIATLPALGVACAGSALGAWATFAFLPAALGMNQGEMRALGAVLAVSFLATLLSGPLAAALAVGADAVYGGGEVAPGALVDDGADLADDAPAPAAPRRVQKTARSAPKTMYF